MPIKYVGDCVEFFFDVDGVAYSCSMNALGILIMHEPDVFVAQYQDWKPFEEDHPEFAEAMKGVMQRKMQETINMIDMWEGQPVHFPAVIPDNERDPMYR